MRGTTTHPGVNLYQRAKAGVWFIRFFDTRTGQRVQVSKSTLTDDHDIATKIANNVHAFVNARDVWTDPPEGYHPRAYELLGVLPHDAKATVVKNALGNLPQGAALLVGTIPTNLSRQEFDAEVKRSLEREAEARKSLADLQDALTSSRQTADEWKRRAIAAEGQLARMGKQANKNRAAIDGLTLQDALTAWKKTLTGDSDYVANQQGDAAMFVRKFGEKTMLTDVADKAKQIDLWIRGIKRLGKKQEDGKRIEKTIGASRRQEIRRVVLRFLRESGAEMDAKAIKRPSKKDVRNDRGAIRWLTRDQAQAVAGAIVNPYYADCFRVQLALGLRPDELLTLKKADFSELGGKMTLTLSPLGNLTLKEGSRSVIVPEHVRPILTRRMEGEKTILFDYVGRTVKKAGQPWPDAKFFDRKYIKALRTGGKAAGVPFELDCRVARRTCATLLLGAGVAPKAVADILGDNLQTVLEHYAAAIPGTNDPSKAAVA